MVKVLESIKWFCYELGLTSLYGTGRDAWLIILARSLRMIAFGTNALVLALFFSALEFSDEAIGLFMTLTLAGDVVLGLVLTLVADKLGRRRVLLAGSLLMVTSGAVFGFFENFWILLIAAIFGVMSVSASDFGPFRAIEESILSQLTTPNTRSDCLSWYVTFSSLGSSVGTEVSGRIVHMLQSKEGWTLKQAYHSAFWIYSAMGIVNMVLMLALSQKCEAPKTEEKVEEETEMLMMDDEHSEDGENNGSQQAVAPTPSAPPKKRGGFFSNFSQISKATRSIMYTLWVLLMVDTLADGMVSYPLTTYYMDRKFDVSKSTLGDVMSVNYFLASLSTIFAGPLARHIGLVNTMVFTHVPSSAAVLFFPLPNNLPMTVALLLIRGGLNNMDQAPRSAFIAAVVKPEERTAVMGITTMLRTLASTTGPTVTGFLAGSDRFWIAFVVAGALRLAYDLGLWLMFINVKLYEHEKEKPTPETRSRPDDEEEFSLSSTEDDGSEDDSKL